MSYAEPCPNGCAAGCETCERRTACFPPGRFLERIARTAAADVRENLKAEVRKAINKAGQTHFRKGV